MRRNLNRLRGMLAPAMALAFATLARSAEEGGSPAEQPVGTVFKWIHFVILAVLLVYVVRVYGRPYFRRQADAISAAISKATVAKAEAEARLKEAAGKLTSLEQEVAQFRAQAQKEAAAELERLRAMTNLDIEKIGIAAKAEIDAAEHAARVELKALAARLAVDRAESMVATQMTPAIQEAMINHFVQTLQGRPN
ncbi:MAG: ATP synthase F0 subunit B [Candidatus Acidiferrum sp.]